MPYEFHTHSKCLFILKPYEIAGISRLVRGRQHGHGQCRVEVEVAEAAAEGGEGLPSAA